MFDYSLPAVLEGLSVQDLGSLTDAQLYNAVTIGHIALAGQNFPETPKELLRGVEQGIVRYNTEIDRRSKR